MAVRITNSSYCLCGDWVEGVEEMFRAWHSDDGHGRFFASKAEAEKAAREVSS